MKLYNYTLLSEEDQVKAQSYLPEISDTLEEESDVDEEDIEDMTFTLATNFAIYGRDKWSKLYEYIYKDMYGEKPEVPLFEEEEEEEDEDE